MFSKDFRMPFLDRFVRRSKPITAYTSLRNDSSDFGSDEGLLKEAEGYEGQSSGQDDIESRLPHQATQRLPTTLVWMNILLFVLSMISFASTFLAHPKPADLTTERNYFLKQVSEPSPILEQLDISMSTWRLNGTFIEQNPINIFRQRPSPEVDRAWERIETQTPIAISREDILNQGKDPDDSVKWPEEFGFGKDAYIGRIDVFHQIHCLNILRKHLHFNYEYYYAGKRMNKYHELHTGHCVYTLLQNLMCTGNTDVYPHFWADAQRNAVPDFSINHKCRDFDAILQWHNERAVPLDEFGALERPDGFEPRIMVHAFKEAFEWYDEEHPDDGDLGTAVG